jgi:glycogen debranching enzyme
MGTIFIATLTLFISTHVLGANIKEIAKKSLETNIVKLDKGLFLSAGAHQFKSFWTRDFCFSSRGLLAINRGDVVKSHFTLCRLYDSG